MARTLYPMLLAALLAACGDNYDAPPGDGGGDDGGGDDGGAEVCTGEAAEADLSGGSFTDELTIAGFTGMDGAPPTVFDFARDTDGTIVATGKFKYVGSDRVEPLLRRVGGAWVPARTTWELTPPGAGFSAVAINAEGDLALATYDDFGARSGQIWIDDGTGLRVIASFEGLVRRIVWYDGALWAAGVMDIQTSGAPVERLAVWNGTTWSPPPGGAPTFGPSLAGVYALHVDGDDLLVGGDFVTIGGVSAESAASYNGTSWSALSLPGTTVYAFARDASNTLYAAGSFTDRFGTTGGVVVRSGNTWQLLGGGLRNRNIVGAATDLAFHDGSLFVTGCFQSANGDVGDVGAVASRGIIRWDGAWHSLDDGTRGTFSPWIQTLKCGDEGNGSVFDVENQRLISDGDRVLLGGTFPGVAGVLSQSIIAYEGDAWVAQTPTGDGLGGNLDRIGASDTCEVYGYGFALSHASGTPIDSQVVRYTGSGWQAIDDSVVPYADGFCAPFAVSHAGDAVLACSVFPVDGEPGGRLYKVDGDRLVEAATGLPFIETMAFGPDDTLWLGGTTLEGTGFVARWDGTTATIVDDTFDAGVKALSPVGPDEVIAGGDFLRVGDLEAARIARYAGGAWTALGEGLPGFPTALAHDGARVYASTYDDGNGAYLLGAFDGATWVELATPAANLTPDPDFNFNALRVVGSTVIGAGSAELDDGTGRGALMFTSGRFSAVGGGVNASILTDIAVTSDALWFAGVIAEAGPDSARRSSVGVARFDLQP